MKFRIARPFFAAASFVALTALAACSQECKDGEACCTDGACTDECKDKAAGAAAATTTAAGAAAVTTNISAPINATCPVRGGPSSAEHTVAYKGTTVGFCCGGCVKKFNAMDDAGKDAILAKANTAK